MTTILSIYHNVTEDGDGRLVGMLDGYERSHQLVKVYELPVRNGADWLAACEYAWMVCNVGHEVSPPHAGAVAYRARDNRSLSTGDVIEMGGRWYAAMSIGWGDIPTPPKSHIVEKVMHGTTPASLAITRCGADAYLCGEIRQCNTVLGRRGQCFNADMHINTDTEQCTAYARRGGANGTCGAPLNEGVCPRAHTHLADCCPDAAEDAVR